MAWLLRDRLRHGDADDAQDRRSYPAAVARDHSAPLETPTNDRQAPRHARCEPERRVEAGLSGPSVLVGAEPRARGRPRPAQRVLRQARADLRGRLASPGTRAHRRPRPATTGAMGMIVGEVTRTLVRVAV